jgi:hypothetical protein
VSLQGVCEGLNWTEAAVLHDMLTVRFPLSVVPKQAKSRIGLCMNCGQFERNDFKEVRLGALISRTAERSVLIATNCCDSAK